MGVTAARAITYLNFPRHRLQFQCGNLFSDSESLAFFFQSMITGNIVGPGILV